MRGWALWRRHRRALAVVFKVHDMDRDGYISNGELFLVRKMMVGTNLGDTQLQQIVGKMMRAADKDGDGKISVDEFANFTRKVDIANQLTLSDFDEFVLEGDRTP
jgi:serine/threonine-protein phosphatase 2B regulatory subunit